MRTWYDGIHPVSLLPLPWSGLDPHTVTYAQKNEMSTRFLASVSNLEEAATILAAGADIIDIKDPGKGALGAVQPVVVKQIVKYISGQVMNSATIGDLPMEATCISNAIGNMQATGVDIIKIGVFADFVTADILQVIKRFTDSGCRVVLVYFADLKPRLEDFSALADAGIHGVMLDTADKSNGNLRTILGDNELESFVQAAQAAGLMTGLAGSLQQRDIKPLLDLKPDLLGFRSALCIRHQRKMHIDVNAVNQIRSMIPLADRHLVKRSTMIQEV